MYLSTADEKQRKKPSVIVLQQKRPTKNDRPTDWPIL